MKCIFLIICHFPLILSAQTLENWVLGAGGETKTHSGVNLSWTLGETNISTIPTYSGCLTEGFHQPYLEILSLNPPKTDMIEIGWKIFPNPVSDQLIVQLTDKLPRDFDLKMYDNNGQLLKYVQAKSAIQSFIDLRDLPSAVYLLTAQSRQDLLSPPQSFQIIKQ